MKKIVLRVILILLCIYFVFTFISQQKSLNAYESEKQIYEEELKDAKKDKEDLENTKNNLDSLEFIEKTARDKLDMYLPNERIYIDISR